MPLVLGWKEIALRLALSALAGGLIGYNRGEHGRPAGLRTTLLVCMAASIAMIQMNLLLTVQGKPPTSFVVMDVMRLPLGILSGMGFIGAGAILRKDNLVLGVTTAATLWYVTVMGLCIGGGQLGLGMAALAIALGTLWGLKFLEKHWKREFRARLLIRAAAGGPSEDEVAARLQKAGLRAGKWTVQYSDGAQCRQLTFDVHWRCKSSELRPPPLVRELADHPHVQDVEWKPGEAPENS